MSQYACFIKANNLDKRRGRDVSRALAKTEMKWALNSWSSVTLSGRSYSN